LREFVDAADKMRVRSLSYWPECNFYDTARSRVDVEEIVKDRDALLTNWRECEKKILELNRARKAKK